jgi:hypothetical protein
VFGSTGLPWSLEQQHLYSCGVATNVSMTKPLSAAGRTVLETIPPHICINNTLLTTITYCNPSATYPLQPLCDLTRITSTAPLLRETTITRQTHTSQKQAQAPCVCVSLDTQCKPSLIWPHGATPNRVPAGCTTSWDPQLRRPLKSSARNQADKWTPPQALAQRHASTQLFQKAATASDTGTC